MEFRLLGAAGDRRHRRQLAAGRGQAAQRLVLLLLHRNEAVSSDRLIDALWGERPPATAAKLLQNHVGQLRRVLDDRDGARLRTRGRGYVCAGRRGSPPGGRPGSGTRKPRNSAAVGVLVPTTYVPEDAARRGRAGRLWSALALLAGALLAAAVLACAQGEVRLSDATTGWARACAGRPPRADRELLARCAHVRGRVLWTGHHRADPHLAVLAAFRVFVVKLNPGSSMPPPGTAIAVTGPLVRARNGFREVEGWKVDGG